jgi:uncharacterized protein
MSKYFKFIIAISAILLVIGGILTFRFLIDKSTEITFFNDEKSVLTIKAEIANGSRKLQKGLMYRESMAVDSGMLFLFNDNKIHSMWMKNMKFPIDIIFLNADKQIVNFYENVPSCEALPCPTYPAVQASPYAIELPAGTIERNMINENTKVEF